jgi:hypothetical protein
MAVPDGNPPRWPEFGENVALWAHGVCFVMLSSHVAA